MSTDSALERYHRRRRWPITIVVLVLLVGAGVLWFQILRPPPAEATGCNQPGPAPATTALTTRSVAVTSGTRRSGSAAPTASTTASTASTVLTTLGDFVSPNTLAATRPATPRNVNLQVFNGSTTRGLAQSITNDLREAGFESVNKNAIDDVLYPAHDLVCQSMIRFGPAGQAQARTVLIVAPCAQLVMDNRVDESVDLAVGRQFRFAPVTTEMRKQLKALNDAANAPAVIEGVTAAPRPLASLPPLPKANCDPNAPLTTDPTTPRGSSIPSSGPVTGSTQPSGSAPATR